MTEQKQKKPRVKKVKPIDNNMLSLVDVKQQNNKYKETIKVEFDNGKYTTIYRYFQPTKIEKLLEDFSTFISDYQNAGFEIKDKDILNYIGLHIIQHFSSIIGTFPSGIHEKMDIYQQLLDSEYGVKLMESFDEKEIGKVYETMYRKLDQFMKLQEHDKELRKQLRDKIDEMDNADILREVILGETSEVNGE